MEKEMEKMIRERTDSQLRDIHKLELLLEDLSSLVTERKIEEYEEYALDAALRSEKLTCKMRHLLYQSAVVKKPAYLVKAAEMQGITVREYPDMVEIELPVLLPKRKSKADSEYLTDALYFMLENYASEHRHIHRFESAVICFIYEYDSMLPRNRVLDYDNIEKKQLLDVISTFFLIDDSGLCCETFNMTSISNADKTRVLVMTRERFVSWIKEIQEL